MKKSTMIKILLLLGIVCMVGGCKVDENKEQEMQSQIENEGTLTEETDNSNSKYMRIPEQNLSDLINADLAFIGGDKVTAIIGYDESSIEEYLNEWMYKCWYKRGENTPVEMNSTKFGDLEYGVFYIFSACVEGAEIYGSDIIKLYDIKNKNNIFYMSRTSTYGFAVDGSVVNYSYMTLIDAKGEAIEIYYDVPQSAFDSPSKDTQDDYYDEYDFSDTYYTDYVDEFDYKVEASATEIDDYSDLLRNPMDYYGVKICEHGEVIWVGDDAFLMRVIGGMVFYVMRGENTPNLLIYDDCIVFGELCGTMDYTSTNEYGTVTTHTAAGLYAPYIITDKENGTPCDERTIELLYGSYSKSLSSGGNKIVITPETIGYAGSEERYEYTVTFGNRKVSMGHDFIPITLSYYIPSQGRTVTAEGSFDPWGRGLWWNGEENYDFLFRKGVWYNQE